MKKLISIILIALCSLCYVHSQSPGTWKQKCSHRLLQSFDRDEIQNFIIVMNEQADVRAVKFIHGKEAKGRFVYEALSSFAEKSQREIISELQSENVSYQPFWVVNAIAVKGNLSLAKKIASRNDVQQLIANSAYHVEDAVEWQPVSTRDVAVSWGLDTIHAPAVWAMGFKGQGVVVGGDDTGYDWMHPAIQSKYRGWNGTVADHNYNWHDAIHQPDVNNPYPNPCGLNLTSPCDDYGHGTHTMGTMVGSLDTFNIGVAPEAKWIGERNMEQGWGMPSTYIECFQWFVAPTDLNNQNPDPLKAPDVINNSWGCPADEGCDQSNFSVMETVVDNVKAAGIVVVVSAGNDGPYCNTIMNPASIFESSFTIGALNDSAYTIANFSSRGDVTADSSNNMKPNVIAPGVNIFSCIPGNNYANYSGTSMAGPHVAGAVALILSANPSLKGEVDLVENILEQTARHLTTTEGCGGDQSTDVPNNTFGWGLIDVYAAVMDALTITNNDILQSENSISVYPTLVNDAIIISSLHPFQKGTLELFSVTGSCDRIQPLLSTTNVIHVNTLPAGIYFYRVIVDGLLKTGKIVKE